MLWRNWRKLIERPFKSKKELRAALEEQKRAQKALEELQLSSQRKAVEKLERAQIRAVRQ